MGTVKKVSLGLVAAFALLGAGCEERRRAPQVESDARQGINAAGREVGEAARDVTEGGAKFVDGVKDGFGGSGPVGNEQVGDGKIGDRPGVVNDGEGPLEERR